MLHGRVYSVHHRTPGEWEYTPCDDSLRGLLPSKKYQSPCQRELTPVAPIYKVAMIHWKE